jgi:hypothetical protein
MQFQNFLCNRFAQTLNQMDQLLGVLSGQPDQHWNSVHGAGPKRTVWVSPLEMPLGQHTFVYFHWWNNQSYTLQLHVFSKPWRRYTCRWNRKKNWQSTDDATYKHCDLHDHVNNKSLQSGYCRQWAAWDSPMKFCSKNHVLLDWSSWREELGPQWA